MNWSRLKIFLPFHTSKTLCHFGKCLAAGISQTIGFCISSPSHINTFTQRPYQTSIQARAHCHEVDVIVNRIRRDLEFDDAWYEKSKDAREAFNYIRRQLEVCGVVVMMSSKREPIVL